MSRPFHGHASINDRFKAAEECLRCEGLLWCNMYIAVCLSRVCRTADVRFLPEFEVSRSTRDGDSIQGLITRLQRNS